jgi:hypothetical protein
MALSKRSKAISFFELNKMANDCILEITFAKKKATIFARWGALLGSTGGLAEFEQITNYDEAKGNGHKTRKRIFSQDQIKRIRFIQL